MQSVSLGSDISGNLQTGMMKRGSKILVVDDQVTNFDIIEGFLMILGFTNIKANVDFVNNGPAALHLLEKAIDEEDATRYGLVLIESKMPLMDGFETIKKLKHQYEGIGLPKAQ
jgi:CheY-like chemotaxis protein